MDQANSPQPPDMPSAERAPQRSKRKSVLVVVLIIAALLVFGAGRLTHHYKNSALPANTDTAALTAMQKFIADAGQQIATQYGKDYDTTTQVWYAENTTEGDPVSVPGYNFKISSSTAPTLHVIPVHISAIEGITVGIGNIYPAHDIAAVYTTLRDNLGKSGFQEVNGASSAESQQLSDASTGDVTRTLQNVKTQQQCKVTEEPSYYSLAMTCTSPAVNRALAAQMAPFVALYTKGKSQAQQDTSFGPLDIRSQDPTHNSEGPIFASESAGYDVAELVAHKGTSHYVALFYAHNNAWRYITDAGDEYGFDCTPIWNDPEARKALHDQVCYDFKDNSGQIRVDSDRRALQ